MQGIAWRIEQQVSHEANVEGHPSTDEIKRKLVEKWSEELQVPPYYHSLEIERANFVGHREVENELERS